MNVAAKAALLLLLAHSVVFSELPQYQGKGMVWRLSLYPVSALVVPVAWMALGARRRCFGYPHLLDLCVAAPFVIDTAGNAANLYDTVDWWDDVMHLVTWVPWVIAFGLAFRYSATLPRWAVFGLTIGAGAATHIVWELLEYVSFIRNNSHELANAYRDTMGDLAMSLCGSIVGAIAVITVLWARGTPASRGEAHGAGVHAAERHPNFVLADKRRRIGDK